MFLSKLDVGLEEECRNGDGVEKLRIPSLEQSARKEKSQFSLDMLSSSSSSSFSSSSEESTPNSPSGSSLNFMKNTSSSEARRNDFQNLPASRSSSKPSKSLTRISSARFRRTLMRKSSGGAETKRKVKQLRGDSDEQESQSPVWNSKSGNRNNGQRVRDVSVYSKPKSISSSQRSGIMLTRKPSLKPVRKLAKMAAPKSKKDSMETTEFPESCVEKTTCSSALKGSKFPDDTELQPGEEKESERIAVKKICPYSYCSLHGHSHANVPPLKRFKSIRKRALRAQKNKRSDETEQLSQAKQSSNRKEGTRASKMVGREEPVAHEMTGPGESKSTAMEKSNPSILTDIINSGVAFDAEGKGNIIDAGECNLKDSLASPPAFDHEQIECQSKASEKLKGDLAEEIDDSLSRSSSTSSVSLNSTAEVQEINPKYIRMWHLVYKNVLDNNSGNGENDLPLPGMDKETSKEVDNKAVGETDSSSYKLLSNIDQEGADVYPDAAYRKLELYKNEAIKLVQEAFDRILLPEIQDQSPRLHDLNAGEKLFGRIRAEVEGSSILVSSSSISSAGEDLVHDQEETQTKAENVTSMEENKTMSIIENRSNQPAVLKRWSSLKKLILLKRFVKALEKVRKINPQKPRYLPVKPDPEGEKVHLQRQTTEERKNSEEWMLDYAIQQVVSKLAPAQKKRVSLLVEAFETILPLPGVEAHSRAKAGFPVDPRQVHGSSDGTDKESGRQDGAASTLLEKLSNMKNIVKGSAGQANNTSKVERWNFMTFSNKNEADVELEKSEQAEPVNETADRGWRVGEVVARNTDKVEKETTTKQSRHDLVDMWLPETKDAIADSETSKKTEGTSYQEVSVNGKLLKISKGVISRLNSELYNGDLEPDQTNFQNDSLISVTTREPDTAKSLTSEDHEKSTEVNNAECSTSAYELLEKTRAAIFHKNRTAQSEASSVEDEFVPPEEIKTSSSIGKANETQEEKKNTSMWFLIYKHMASSIDAEDGSKPPADKMDNDEKEFSPRKQSMKMEGRFANDPDVELQCIEAVKLVNEAIDEIPLPENSNSTHDGSFSANLIMDQALPEEKQDEGSELFTSITNHSEIDASRVSDRGGVEYDSVSNPDKGSMKSVDMNSQEEKELNSGSKPNRQVLKNWSNLKKVILLKRFIKAMEKVKKFNPRQPNFLALVQDAESEKVQLRHQDTEDRKNAEEWMLDYALQQAVAKLTPARKRKVELLVQAFETVNPTIRK